MNIETRFVTTASLSQDTIDSMRRLFQTYYEADDEFFENYEYHVRKRTHALIVYERGEVRGFMTLFLTSYSDCLCVGMSALILEHAFWGKVPLLKPLVDGIKEAAIRDYDLTAQTKVVVISFAACVRTYFFNRKMLPILVPSMESPNVPDDLREIRDRFIADTFGKNIENDTISNDIFTFKSDEFSPLDDQTRRDPSFQWFLKQIGGMENYGNMDLVFAAEFPNPL